MTALLLRKQDVSSGPTQRALAACGRRWPAAQALEFDACRGLSFRGCVLPPGLRAVRLAGTNRLMPSGLAPLAARSATLQQLSYRQHSSGSPCITTASSAGLCKELGALLPRLASLTELSIDSNVLPPHKTSSADDDTTDFLASLRTMPLQHLKLLRFADLAGSKVMPAVTRALCESLSHLTRLQTLHITLPLGLRGAKALAPVLQRLVRLRNLGLADCNLNAEERGGAGAGGKRVKAQRQQAPAGAGPDEGGTRFAIGFLTDALAALPHIEQLHLQCNSLGHALLLLPPRLPHLHTLNIAANCPDEKKRPGASDPAPVAPMLAQLLPRYPTLTELDIGRNALEVEDAAQLSAALLGTAALRVLRMAACGPNQRAVLGPTLVAVCRLPCLETLDLRHNPLEALGEGQAMAAFWRALPQLRTLRRLDLHHTRLDAPAVAALCKVGRCHIEGRKEERKEKGRKKGYAPLGRRVWGGKQCRVRGMWPLQHHCPVRFSSLSRLGCQLVHSLPVAGRAPNLGVTKGPPCAETLS